MRENYLKVVVPVDAAKRDLVRDKGETALAHSGLPWLALQASWQWLRQGYELILMRQRSCAAALSHRSNSAHRVRGRRGLGFVSPRFQATFIGKRLDGLPAFGCCPPPLHFWFVSATWYILYKQFYVLICVVEFVRLDSHVNTITFRSK